MFLLFFAEKYAKMVGLEPGLRGKTFIVQVIVIYMIYKNYMTIINTMYIVFRYNNCIIFRVVKRCWQPAILPATLRLALAKMAANNSD